MRTQCAFLPFSYSSQFLVLDSHVSEIDKLFASNGGFPGQVLVWIPVGFYHIMADFHVSARVPLFLSFFFFFSLYTFFDIHPFVCVGNFFVEYWFALLIFNGEFEGVICAEYNWLLSMCVYMFPVARLGGLSSLYRGF